MTKKRISLTIDLELLRKVDSIIDETLIKNRSQAFEVIIKEYFKKIEVRKCFILVLNWKYQFKEINELTLLSHNLKKIKDANISDIFIVTPHKQKFLNISEIRIIEEKEPKGNIGALWLCKDKIEKDENFLVIYENILINFDIKELIEFHIKKSALATFVVSEYENKKSRDFIEIKGDRIVNYKWVKDGIKTNISGCGVFIFNEKIFNFLPRSGMLEDKVFPILSKTNNFYAFFISSNEWKEFE